MAVPTISSIAPTSGHSGGQTLIEIVGTNFALPPDPPATGPTTAPGPSLSVTIGGRACTQIAVVSPTLAYALTPRGEPGSAKDLVLKNLDTTGAPIAGEEVTLPAAFSFVRPDLTQEGHLATTIRTLIQELTRQIVPNVYFTTHTDFDSETGDALNYAYVAAMPALILGNVDIIENRDQHTDEENGTVDVGTDRFVERRPPTPVDVRGTIVGVVGGANLDNPVSMFNLLQAVRGFFKKNPWLFVPRDKDDPTFGEVRYELDWTFGGPVSVTHAGDSNVESFGGQFFLRNVLLEHVPGLPTGSVSGVPSTIPAESIRGFGWKALDTDEHLALDVQKKPSDDED